MKKISLVILAALVLSGCTKNQVGCAVEDTVVSVASQGIVAALQCSNPAAVQASIKMAADKLNICTQPAAANLKLALPAALCGPLIDMLLTTVVTTAIPSAWGCSAQVAGDQLKALLNKACSGN